MPDRAACAFVRAAQALLADAAAAWALTRGDVAAAVRHHLAAAQWRRAHALLVARLAPALLCGNR